MIALDLLRGALLAVASILVALLAAIDGWRGVEPYPTECEP